jgi:hypothetical protein
MNIESYRAGREAAHGPWAIRFQGLRHMAAAMSMVSLGLDGMPARSSPPAASADTQQAHHLQEGSLEGADHD